MRARRVSTIFGTIAAVIVVGLLAAVLISLSRGGGGTVQVGSETPAQRFARLGGTQIVLQVNPCQAGAITTTANCVAKTQIATFMQVEQQRAATFLGVKDAIVTNPVDDQIQIQLPGYENTDNATLLLTSSDDFDVVDTGDTQLSVGADISNRLCPYGYPCPSNSYIVYFTGSQIDPSSITAQGDASSGQPIVTFAFAGAAREQFATYTNQRIGQYLTLTLDGVVLESATIQSEITGTVQITGLTSFSEAQNLASTLKIGSLPMAAILLSETFFGPGSTCPTPIPGTPAPGTATPAPNATETPALSAPYIPSPTASATSAGQSANFTPVFSGGPTRNGDCGTPTVTPADGTPAPTIAPTPMPVIGTPTVTPPATPTPKP